ncbi:unnamed protein product [Timema podura]|uniref:Uncharacterized protein n=1 Tax=Timema podura TaxID=61482 RepID=A0ABN7P0K3_TIMPD|nr:unnamed protein product [Timema podura]
MECVEKIIKKDWLHPLTGAKLTERDIITLQRLIFCRGIAANAIGEVSQKGDKTLSLHCLLTLSHSPDISLSLYSPTPYSHIYEKKSRAKLIVEALWASQNHRLGHKFDMHGLRHSSRNRLGGTGYSTTNMNLEGKHERPVLQA